MVDSHPFTDICKKNLIINSGNAADATDKARRV